MMIKTDRESAKVIQSLCDIALRAGGINNLAAVQHILRSIVLYEEDTPPEKCSEKEKSSQKKADE